MSHPPTGSVSGSPTTLATLATLPRLLLLPLLAAVTLLLSSLLPLTTSASAAAPARTTVAGWSGTPTSVTSGGVYLARVTVSGGARAVHLQRRVGTTWRTVETGRSGSDGRVALSWATPSSARSVVLRVRVPRTPAYAGKVTPRRTVAIRSESMDPELAEVLELVNDARSEARTCGGVRYPAVPPVKSNARLNRAADDFAQLMATEDFFSHDSPDGSDPGDRITDAGYRWRSYGENIAAGYDGAAAVVQGWLESAGHCKNLMGSFADIGLGYAVDPSSTYGTYWVQDFATAQ